MKVNKIALTVIVAFCCLPLRAQDVHWACKIDRVSSAYFESSSQYKALQREQFSSGQALGEPNVYPAYGLNPSTWVSSEKRGLQFIQLSFCSEVQARQIVVVETLHPGQLTKVYGIDKKGEFELASFSQPHLLIEKSRVLNFFIDTEMRKITGVKLVYKIGQGEPVGIDAVGVSESRVPYRLDIPLAENLNKDVRAVKLSSTVNSDDRELNPVLTQDKKRLFFSRTHVERNESGSINEEDIWMSELDGFGQWREAIHIDTPINTRGPNFVASAYVHGDTTVLLLGNRYKGNKVFGGLSICKVHDGKWIGPVAIDMEDFYNHSDRGNFFLSETNKVIVLAISRNDSRGGRDLYVSIREGNKWSAPVSLGDAINTVGDESTPFMSEDNNVLYFSSDGYRGNGGSDVFVSRRLDDTWTNWSSPRNLGQTVNSDLDDFGFTYYGGKALFVRGDQDNTDIMELDGPLFEIKNDSIMVDIIAVTTQGKILPSCKIIVDETQVYNTDANGKLSLRLPIGEKTIFEGKYEGYEQFASDTIAIDDKRIMLALRFKSGDTTAALKPFNFALETNLYFDFDKSEVRPEFNFFLDDLAQALIASGSVIKIIGFTDHVGTDDYNIALSKRRADSVRQILVRKGVHETQLIAVGNGKYSGGTQTKSRVVKFELIP